MTASIQPADPRARRRAIVLLIVAIAIGMVVIGAAQGATAALGEWLGAEPERLRRWIRIVLMAVLGMVVLPPWATAAYLAHLAGRVIHHERFPPPGAAVIRDTRILEGSAARRFGARLRWAAWALAALGAIVGVWIWRILRVLWDGLNL